MNHPNTYRHAGQSSSMIGGFTFIDILNGFWKRKIPICIFVALCLIATYLVISRVEPLYKSETKILIEGHDPDVNRFSVKTQASPADAMQVSSQAQILLSQDLAGQVIKKLNLETISEFNTKSSLPFIGGNKSFDKVSQVREAYFNNLTVYPVAETRIVVVEFSSTSAQRSADIANALAQLYVESTRKNPRENGEKINAYLSKEINKLKSDINAKEKALEKFRARNGLIQGNNGTLYAQELAELNRQIAETSSVRAQASAKAASARSLLGGDQAIDIAGDVIKSELIGRLREQQIQLRRELTEKSTTYLPAHPVIVQLNRQLQNLDRLVNFEVTKIAASLSNQAKVAAARENTLRAKLNRLKAKAVTQGQSVARLNSLQRDIDAKRNLLNTYLTKQADSLSLQNINNIPASARIISQAVAPAQPYFPKTVPIMFLSLISTLVLSFVYSFLRDSLSSSPASSMPARNPMQAAYIGEAPTHNNRTVPRTTQPSQANSYGSGQGASHASLLAPVVGEATQFNLALSDKTDMTTLYQRGNALETGLLDIATHSYQFLQSTNSKTILVTSDENFQPKSFLSAGLARIFAQKGLKTIIVDADMMAPSISHLMGVQPSPGLSEILTGAAPFSDTVVKDRNTGASILPAGARGSQAYTQLSSDSATLILRSLSMVYDIIIIHAPGINEHTATTFLANQSAYVCLASSTGWGNKQQSRALANTLLAGGSGHVAQISCAASSGAKFSSLFKKKAA